MRTVSSNAMDLLELHDTWGEEILERTTPHSGNSLDRHLAWQVTGNTQYLEELYADEIAENAGLMYVQTEGHLWTDRVGVSSLELQRARMGGVGSWRSAIYPGHLVSWRFDEPHRPEDVAIKIPHASRDYAEVEVFNLKHDPVEAQMIAWDMDPGVWQVIEETEFDGEFMVTDTREVSLKRKESIEVSFAPFTNTRLTLERVEEATPLRERPDIGIGEEGIRFDGNRLRVSVHNLGSQPTPETELIFVDTDGSVVDRQRVPAMEPPLDLQPKVTEVTLSVRQGTEGTLILDPDDQIEEITKRNNRFTIENE